MGADHHKFAKDQPMKPRTDKVIPAQYKVCYQKWVADPDYIYNLMHENKTLAANILDFFPNARSSYEQFLQMIFYLRRYDPTIQRNQYASYNVHKTTLLDRFFMLMLKLTKYEQLEAITINRQQMENLFIELMKFFIPHPQKGFINKLCTFIGFKDVQQITLKQYSASLREFLPHIQKHIKDYYTLKFFNMQPNGYLLQHFKSQILVEDAIFLSMKIAQITNPHIKLLYQPRSCGVSFHSIQKHILGYTGPWLLALEHVQKDNEGKSHSYKLGAYQSGPILDLNTFQGDVRGFLFTVEPKLKLMSPDKGNGGNHYFFINNLDQKSTKMRKGLGFGGDKNKQNFKLWIDQDMDKSTVYNGLDQTYGFGSLINPSTTKLNIIKMQIWALGTEVDLNNLHEYWDARSSEIQKRRKVNKTQFLKGDAGLMFENTFAHRDQVYGQISKKEQSHEPGHEQKLQKSYSESEHFSLKKEQQPTNKESNQQQHH